MRTRAGRVEIVPVSGCAGGLASAGAPVRARHSVRPLEPGRGRGRAHVVDRGGARSRRGRTCSPAASAAQRRPATRVSIPDRTGLTAGLRYRFTGPVRPDTGRNRTKGNLNSFEFKSRRSNGTDRYTGRTVRFTGRFDRYTGHVGGVARTGKPVGYTGIPDGYTGKPAGWTGIPVRFAALQK